jgi:hypothetical protein
MYVNNLLISAVRAKNVSAWLFCGVEFYIFIHQKVTGLVNLDCNIPLISDCISSRTLVSKQRHIDGYKKYWCLNYRANSMPVAACRWWGVY